MLLSFGSLRGDGNFSLHIKRFYGNLYCHEDVNFSLQARQNLAKNEVDLSCLSTKHAILDKHKLPCKSFAIAMLPS